MHGHDARSPELQIRIRPLYLLTNMYRLSSLFALYVKGYILIWIVQVNEVCILTMLPPLSLLILSVFSPTWRVSFFYTSLSKMFVPVYKSVVMLCYLLKWPYFFGLCPSCNYGVVPHFWSRLYFTLQARTAPNLVVHLERAVLSQWTRWWRMARSRNSSGLMLFLTWRKKQSRIQKHGTTLKARRWSKCKKKKNITSIKLSVL